MCTSNLIGNICFMLPYSYKAYLYRKCVYHKPIAVDGKTIIGLTFWFWFVLLLLFNYSLYALHTCFTWLINIFYTTKANFMFNCRPYLFGCMFGCLGVCLFVRWCVNQFVCLFIQAFGRKHTWVLLNQAQNCTNANYHQASCPHRPIYSTRNKSF